MARRKAKSVTYPDAVQPDYEKWKRVSVGMSIDEVTEILGPPLDDWHIPKNGPYKLYGYIDVPTTPLRRSYGFKIGFDENGISFSKSDPFEGRFSWDGLPLQPELLVPQNGQQFDHFPRILDIRWHPVSGEYPIVYDVRIEGFPYPFLEGAPPEIRWRLHHEEFGIVGCHHAETLPGKEFIRVQVRAKNALGESEWSDCRLIEFTR